MADREDRSCDEKKVFQCFVCGLSFRYNDYGNNSKQSSKIVFSEDVFYMDDPFSINKIIPLAVGGVCSNCKEKVCMNEACSCFKGKRYCIKCVKAD